MNVSEKFKTDLATAFARARRPDGSLAPKELESFFARNLGMIPAGTREDLFASFLDRVARNREAAETWLGTIGSIFLSEYDGSPLSLEDWTELREAVNLEAGAFEIELLSYVMSLVLENHAL